MNIIRTATLQDAQRILEIYADYVVNTAVSFEYEPPTLSEMASRMENTLRRYPYLVVEEDGVIQGYCYAGPFIRRAAYDHAAELSIYLDRSARRRGYGRALYEAMEDRLHSMGIINLYACIGDPIEEDQYLTRDSERFHRRMGFEKVGTFHRCGRKFGRWYNMIWMEKIIGEHDLSECRP